MSALVVTAPEHAISELARAEMAQNEAAGRLHVEWFAREEIEVRGAVVRKRVATRVALGEEHHAGDGQRPVDALFRDGRRAHGRQG